MSTTYLWLSLSLWISFVGCQKGSSNSPAAEIQQSGSAPAISNKKVVLSAGIENPSSVTSTVETVLAASETSLIDTPSETLSSIQDSKIVLSTVAPSISLAAPSSTLIHAASTSTLAFIYIESPSGGTVFSGKLTEEGGGITVTTVSGNPACTVSVSNLTPAGGMISLSSCQGDGTFTVHIDAATAKDSLGNLSPVSAESPLFTVDNTAPLVGFFSPGSLNVNNSVNTIPTSIRVPFSEPVSPLSIHSFSLGGTCTSPPIIDNVSLSPDMAVATVALSGGTCTDGQILTVSCNPSLLTDSTGNAGTGAIVAYSYLVDTLGPSASLGAPSLTLVNADSTSTLALTYAYAGTAPGGISLNGTLTQGGGGVTVTPLSGNPSCTVAVSDITAAGANIALSNCQGSGTLTVHVDAATAQDSLGNISTVSPESAVITVDNTPPTLVSVSPSSSNVNPTPTSVIATFSKAITPFSAGQFILGGTCTLSPTVGTVTMSSDKTTATLSLSGGTCTDTQSLTVSIDPTKATDLAGNSGAGSIVVRTYTVSTIGPSASLGAPSSTFLNAARTSTLALTYRDSLFGNSTLSRLLTENGGGVTVTTLSGNPSCIVSVSGITTAGAIISLSACSGNGRLTVHVNAGTVIDGLGNSSILSPESAPITVDNTPPTFLVSPASSSVDTMPGSIVVTFSKPMNVAGIVFTVGGTCTTLPLKGRMFLMEGTGGNTVATLPLSGGGCTNEQTLTVTVNPDKVSDLAGNKYTGQPITTTYKMRSSSTILGSPAATSIDDHNISKIALTYSVGVTPSTPATSANLTVTPPANVSCTVSAIGTPALTGANFSLACNGSGNGIVTVQANAARDNQGNAIASSLPVSITYSSTRLLYEQPNACLEDLQGMPFQGFFPSSDPKALPDEARCSSACKSRFGYFYQVVADSEFGAFNYRCYCIANASCQQAAQHTSPSSPDAQYLRQLR